MIDDWLASLLPKPGETVTVNLHVAPDNPNVRAALGGWQRHRLRIYKDRNASTRPWCYSVSDMARPYDDRIVACGAGVATWETARDDGLALRSAIEGAAAEGYW